MQLPSVLRGRYRIEGLLGSGGVAEVYLAFDTLTESRVALKIARDDNPEAAAAIEREFSFAMICRHPALVNPLGLFYQDGSPVMIMPFIEDSGIPSLGDLSEQDTERLLAELLETAAFIHFCGYLYNDFKPANFIFYRDRDGVRPALLDFNLVSRQGEAVARRGTIEYTSPEVLEGQPPTPASDIYSLGVTIYEFFTGHPPFSTSDSPALIKMITEGPPPDFSSVPRRFWQGVAALMRQDPQSRPSNASSAAEALGLGEMFSSLFRLRAGRYLSSGEPPFAAKIARGGMEYIKGGTERAWRVPRASENNSELYYLAREFSLSGWQVTWLAGDCPEITAIRILDHLLETRQEGDKQLLIIDDLSGLPDSCGSKIRALLRRPKCLPIISSGQHWLSCAIPAVVFDPSFDTTLMFAAREATSAFLKRNEAGADIATLSHATGGDPELTYLLLNKAAASGELDLLSLEEEIDISLEPFPEIEAVTERMLSSLATAEKELLSLLSVWGDEFPLILLTEFDDKARQSIDLLLAGNRLKRGKDSVLFSAGLLRRVIYSRIPEKERESYHALWAQAAEYHLSESDGLSDTLAWHWGLSNNYKKGFEANLGAAREYQKKGELNRAKVYSETLLRLSRKGGGPLATALMLDADILKQEGDYPQARRRYLELLQCLRETHNDELKSETFKDLGDLYRSLKNPRKALYYTRLALELFGALGNEQGVANCHNNIGLILWVTQEHEKALSSFHSAAEINGKLSNFQELAKIQSNIGIIKDILGRTSEVAPHFEQAFEDATRAADPWLEALIANNLGYFYIRQNELGKARGYLEKALETSQRIGYTESIINAYSNLGLQTLRAGDLFLSIDYSQKAMAMAESIGNKHLALDAQIYLAEVCILMGNFSLADSVLGGIERDKIYSENKAMAGLVDLRRSWYFRATGDITRAEELARSIVGQAESVGDLRLGLEARLALLAVPRGEASPVSGLQAVSDEAARLGHIDLYDISRLALARAHLDRGDARPAQAWLDEILSRPGQSLVVASESRTLLGRARVQLKKYDEAIGLLSETEAQAAASGFIPGALEAAVELGEVYLSCGKTGRGQEALRRARSYAQRIMASLPDSVSADDFAVTPLMGRLLKVEALSADREYVTG